LHLDIGNGVSLEKVDKFCYLGDMLDADGGCDSAVTGRVRSAWTKFREYLPILPALVAQLAETQCAPTGTVCRRSRGSIPLSTGRFRVRISGLHALRLFLGQAKRV